MDSRDSNPGLEGTEEFTEIEEPIPSSLKIKTLKRSEQRYNTRPFRHWSSSLRCVKICGKLWPIL